MLTKLGEAVGGWKPHATPGGDPLSAIRAAWTSLVGAEVARAAQPVAIQNDALVVLTASGAWSHQLAFLEPDIVRGIVAMPEGRGIARLRFRVGAIRSNVRGAQPAGKRSPRRAAQPPASTSPATTIAEAIAAFRATVARANAAHHAAGARSAAIVALRLRTERAAFRVCKRHCANAPNGASACCTKRRGCSPKTS